MRRKGFTFIEMFLVTAIFAALSVSIFTCLSNGIRLWDRSRQLMAEEESLVFLDRFSSDIRNTFSCSGIAFEGKESAIAFPSVVWTAADRRSVRSDEGMVDQLGRVQYVFDPAANVIIRRQANYSQALKKAWGPDQAVMASVKAFRIRYSYASSQELQSTAAGVGLPAGVELEVVIAPAEGKEEKVFKRYIAVPAGV